MSCWLSNTLTSAAEGGGEVGLVISCETSEVLYRPSCGMTSFSMENLRRVSWRCKSVLNSDREWRVCEGRPTDQWWHHSTVTLDSLTSGWPRRAVRGRHARGDVGVQWGLHQRAGFYVQRAVPPSGLVPHHSVHRRRRTRQGSGRLQPVARHPYRQCKSPDWGADVCLFERMNENS